jgi:hypothetical protein
MDVNSTGVLPAVGRFRSHSLCGTRRDMPVNARAVPDSDCERFQRLGSAPYRSDRQKPGKSCRSRQKLPGKNFPAGQFLPRGRGAA